MTVSFSSHVQITWPSGSTTVLWPQAGYPAGGRAGEHPIVYTWLSMARARRSNSQATGPVVVLNAPGYKIVLAPKREAICALSGKRRS